MQPLWRSFSPRACRSIAVALCGLARTASRASAEVLCGEGHTETATSRGTAYSSFCAAVVRRVVQDVWFGVEFIKRRTVPRVCVRGVGCRSTTRHEGTLNPIHASFGCLAKISTRRLTLWVSVLPWWRLLCLKLCYKTESMAIPRELRCTRASAGNSGFCNKCCKNCCAVWLALPLLTTVGKESQKQDTFPL